MKINKNYILSFLAFSSLTLSFSVTNVFAKDNNNLLVSTLSDNTVLLASPSNDSKIVSYLLHNDLVSVLDIENDWAQINYKNNVGYIKSELLNSVTDSLGETLPVPVETLTISPSTVGVIGPSLIKKTVASSAATVTKDVTINSNVEYTKWSEAKNIFTIGVPAKIYDIYTGKVYYVKSFSNGNHADVEPITKEDTKIMKYTFDNVWSWDVRPVLVTINGKTMAASINGMPHAVGVNDSNDMDGQVCIHFLGSTTHNGNVSYTNLHQKIALEAYNLTKSKN